jgi:hypothetical protein
MKENKGLIDRRKFNVPPPPPNEIKRFNKTISARVEANLVDELERLLQRRYGAKNVPMKSISFVIRTAIIRRIRELREN